MGKAVLLVQSQPSDPSREEEYNKWYDETHLAEVCDIPGIVSARRFKTSDCLVPGGAPDAGPAGYLAIYEVDSDDLQGVLDELVKRAGDGRLQMSDTLQTDPLPVMGLWESVTG